MVYKRITISILSLAITTGIPLYSVEVAAVCQAIRTHDIPSVKKYLKDTSLSLQEKKVLMRCAREVAENYQKEGALSTERKQQLFSTLCAVGVMAGMGTGGIILTYLGMGGSLCHLVKSEAMGKPLLLAFLTLFGGGIVSGYECDTGFFTDKPRYIQNYIDSLPPSISHEGALRVQIHIL